MVVLTITATQAPALDFVPSDVFLRSDANLNLGETVDAPVVDQVVYGGFAFTVSGTTGTVKIPYLLMVDDTEICGPSTTVNVQGFSPQFLQSCSRQLRMTPGLHRLEVRLDPYNVVAETNENNNTVTHTFVVASPTMPDISVPVPGIRLACAAATTKGAEPRLSLFATTKAADGTLAANAAQVEALRKSTGAVVITGFPAANGTADDYRVEPFDVFTPTARIVAWDGRTETALPRPAIDLFAGTSATDPGKRLVLGVQSSGEVYGFVSGREAAAEYLAPAGSGYAVKAATGGLEEGDFCHAERTESYAKAVAETAKGPAANAKVEDDGRVLQAAGRFDVATTLVRDVFAGDTAKGSAYVAKLVATVSSIYERDLKVKLAVEELVFWTEQDPFGEVSTDEQLALYSAYLLANPPANKVNFCNFLGPKKALGGKAYTGAVCNPSIYYGVSNIAGVTSFPVTNYQWDVNVVAHEIGHNFNSIHTHCFEPPIDCCFLECERSCGTTAVPQVGTLMSYCNFFGPNAMVFHPRCVDVMRPFALQQNCLELSPATPGGVFTVENTGTATLELYSLAARRTTPWLSVPPISNQSLPPGGQLRVPVYIDCATAPSQYAKALFRLRSNDPDEGEYPGDLTVEVNVETVRSSDLLKVLLSDPSAATEVPDPTTDGVLDCADVMVLAPAGT